GRGFGGADRQGVEYGLGFSGIRDFGLGPRPAGEHVELHMHDLRSLGPAGGRQPGQDQGQAGRLRKEPVRHVILPVNRAYGWFGPENITPRGGMRHGAPGIMRGGTVYSESASLSTSARMRSEISPMGAPLAWELETSFSFRDRLRKKVSSFRP